MTRRDSARGFDDSICVVVTDDAYRSDPDAALPDALGSLREMIADTLTLIASR